MTRDEALLAANGNQHACAFLMAYVAYCHMLDDVVDKDKPVDDLRLVRESLGLIDELMLNPWVQDNRIVLWPLIVTGFNAWIDANAWERGNDPQKQRDADVVKGVYHELVWMTARLCGGLDHMRLVCAMHREYDHDFDKNNMKKEDR